MLFVQVSASSVDERCLSAVFEPQSRLSSCAVSTRRLSMCLPCIALRALLDFQCVALLYRLCVKSSRNLGIVELLIHSFCLGSILIEIIIIPTESNSIVCRVSVSGFSKRDKWSSSSQFNYAFTRSLNTSKGRCNRDKPPCKYFHPPQHLKDQLLINGRNHLALKNALMQQMGLTPGSPLVPGQVPAVVGGKLQLSPAPPALTFGQPPLGVMATTPYLTGMPQVGSTFSPYFSPPIMGPALMGPDPAASLGMVQQTVVTQQKMPRSDRLEVCREYVRGACKRGECRFAHPADPAKAAPDGSVTVCMDAVKGRCSRDPCRYFHPPMHLQAHIKAAHSMDMKSVGSFYYENFAAFPGMVPYKRAAGDKAGVPVYQPASGAAAAAYQQLLQPFVPVSCEYRPHHPPPPPLTSHSHGPTAASASAFTGLPLNKQPAAAVAAPPPNYLALAQHYAALAAFRSYNPAAPAPAPAPTPAAAAAATTPSLITDLLAVAVNNNNHQNINNNNNDEDLQPFKKMKTT
ncbi:muscleblind-like protein 2 isoform X3 [Nilaparvata lugens]|uniref:muscleblind-like protein 2 isoform X3 n=1 Tax=Nilaparvata lugens TaxID=108931 RepID=UPI00193DB991|nr:muscleblind-like protein 2 isoform X3 [Nilaparvata lugens]